MGNHGVDESKGRAKEIKSERDRDGERERERERDA